MIKIKEAKEPHETRTKKWLLLIKEHISSSLSIEVGDFEYGEMFNRAAP